jgi:hypothetical protein
LKIFKLAQDIPHIMTHRGYNILPYHTRMLLGCISMICGLYSSFRNSKKSAESAKAYNLNFGFDFIRMYALVCYNWTTYHLKPCTLHIIVFDYIWTVQYNINWWDMKSVKTGIDVLVSLPLVSFTQTYINMFTVFVFYLI